MKNRELSDPNFDRSDLCPEVRAYVGHRSSLSGGYSPSTKSANTSRNNLCPTYARPMPGAYVVDLCPDRALLKGPGHRSTGANLEKCFGHRSEERNWEKDSSSNRCSSDSSNSPNHTTSDCSNRFPVPIGSARFPGSREPNEWALFTTSDPPEFASANPNSRSTFPTPQPPRKQASFVNSKGVLPRLGSAKDDWIDLFVGSFSRTDREPSPSKPSEFDRIGRQS